MKFTFSNIGPVKQGEIELGNLTILCGKNNSGKTYISYLLYGFFKNSSSILRDVLTKKNFITYDGDKIILDLQNLHDGIDNINQSVNKAYINKLPSVFNTNSEMFKSTKFKVNVKNITYDKFVSKLKKELSYFNKLVNEHMIIDYTGDKYISATSLKDRELSKALFIIILSQLVNRTIYNEFNNIFLLPAERCGLNLFYRELNINRNNSIYYLNKSEEKSLGKQFSKYPLPISDYINFLNALEPYNKNEVFDEISVALENNIIEGKYTISDEGLVEFLSVENKLIDFHLSSSTAKSLFGLDYYLTNLATTRDLLIIDEPEQNLHPDNQRKLARLLAKLSNTGVKIILSTHSDYIIKELNNLLQLGTNFNGYSEIMQKYGYSQNELINKNDIKNYVLNNNSVNKVDISDEGMIIDSFDEVINSMNLISDEIFYSLVEGE